MSIWQRYTHEQRQEYIKFLQIYGALSNLFRQKQGDLIPYLDSKFQETMYAKVFKSENVDKANTPHDILSIFGSERIGIGIKTWMNSKPSFQKVMQLKRYQGELKDFGSDLYSLAYRISEIKNEKIISDYRRLGLSEDKNIYHYITRDEGSFSINECAYPLIELSRIKIIKEKNFKEDGSSFSWTDGYKDYRFSFADSQIWQKFDSSKKDTTLLDQFKVAIIEDPFEFLLKSYMELIGVTQEATIDIEEVYLPLYSYKIKEVKEKSGLNAWNASSKNKGSTTLRPLNEIYIPVPIEFHRKKPDFFIRNILDVIKEREKCKESKENKPEVRFKLKLPNGKLIPALLTGDNLKNFQSGGIILEEGRQIEFGQNTLGQWLLVEVLGLKDRELVTREWLKKKGTDSVRLWREKGDYSFINIDFAPIGAFEAFMHNEIIIEDE